jgi:hypothetical protein
VLSHVKRGPAETVIARVTGTMKSAEKSETTP